MATSAPRRSDASPPLRRSARLVGCVSVRRSATQRCVAPIAAGSGSRSLSVSWSGSPRRSDASPPLRLVASGRERASPGPPRRSDASPPLRPRRQPRHHASRRHLRDAAMRRPHCGRFIDVRTTMFHIASATQRCVAPIAAATTNARSRSSVSAPRRSDASPPLRRFCQQP